MGRGDAQALVNANPVVPNGPDCDHVNMAFKLLGKRFRQAGEAAVVHPHGEVRPLHIGRADVLKIRIALNPVLLCADAFGGAVFTLGSLGGSAVDLVQDRIVDIGTKRTFDGL